MNVMKPRLESAEVFSLSDIRDKVNSMLEVGRPVDNRDMKKFLETDHYKLIIL